MREVSGAGKRRSKADRSMSTEMPAPESAKAASGADEEWEDYLGRAVRHAETLQVTLTPIRKAVLELLFRHPQGLKAYDLLSRIRAERDNATPPTVYRALDFLMAHGFAHRIGRNSLFVACRHASHRWPSLFLVCPRCRAVTDFWDSALMRNLASTLDAAGFRLEGMEMEVSAICPECGRTEAP